MKLKTSRFPLGFTLIELMIVVTIIGILAAIAIPAFGKYVRKSKTAEAGINVRKLYDGECAYFYEEHVSRAGSVVSKQFVAAGPEPSTVPPGRKVTGVFTSASWTALKFGTDSAIMFRYSTVVSGTSNSAAFTARAEGDLDGDGVTSVFERIGSIGTDGEISGGAGLYSDRDLE